MKPQEPLPCWFPNLSEISGSLFLLAALVNLLLAMDAPYTVLAWIGLAIASFTLGVLWRIHEWQRFKIQLDRQDEPAPPPLYRTDDR